MIKTPPTVDIKMNQISTVNFKVAVCLKEWFLFKVANLNFDKPKKYDTLLF